LSINFPLIGFKTKEKSILFAFLILTIFALLPLGLQANSIITPLTKDTLSPKTNVYKGYRLQLANIVIEKARGNQRKIKCTLINTGREKVRLPFKGKSDKKPIIQYDESLANNGLEAYKTNLERAILKKKFTLDVGKIASNFELKFNISKKELEANKEKENLAKSQHSTPPESEFTDNVYDENYCPDLQIDTLFVAKRSKKWVELAFKITNYGKGPASMFGATQEVDDNVAVRAYASGTPKLSRGDLILGGAFIEDGLDDKNGVLLPGKSFSGSFRVETKKKTRYMPYFILSVDDYQALWECDERNNSKYLLDRRR
jgi:hypothetical protein